MFHPLSNRPGRRMRRAVCRAPFSQHPTGLRNLPVSRLPQTTPPHFGRCLQLWRAPWPPVRYALQHPVSAQHGQAGKQKEYQKQRFHIKSCAAPRSTHPGQPPFRCAARYPRFRIRLTLPADPVEPARRKRILHPRCVRSPAGPAQHLPSHILPQRAFI